MTFNFVDIIFPVILIFLGLKYLITKDFQDRRDVYTEESKKKACIVLGVLLTLVGIAYGVLAILKWQGMLPSKADSDMLTYMLPYIIILGAVIISFIIVYAVVLKKKK